MRTLFGIVLVLLAVAAAVFFADRPGSVSLVWQGWRVETSVAVLVLVVVLLFLLLWLVLGTVARVLQAPARIARRRRETHKLLGYRVLTDGLVAIAAGDVRAADRLRDRAERHFLKGQHDPPPLSRLLAAQAALLKGDDPAARNEFTAMLQSPETEFLGLRGLIVQALKAGDDATALQLTERANRLRPGAAWVLQSQLALEARAGEWRKAEATLEQAVKKKAVTPEQGRRHRVALLLARAQQAAREGSARAALDAAARAHALDQAFAPAAVEYAERLQDSGRKGKALKVLESAWSRASHPSLAAAYDRLISGEAPGARLKQLERLTAIRPSDPEGHLAVASLALANRLWGEARRHLDAAGASIAGPWSRRLCQLMAELEHGERQDGSESKIWLDRAQQAPPEPVWVCSACSAETPTWHPLCPSCSAFDSLVWRVPDRSVGRPVAFESGDGVGVAPTMELDPSAAPRIARSLAGDTETNVESAG